MGEVDVNVGPLTELALIAITGVRSAEEEAGLMSMTAAAKLVEHVTCRLLHDSASFTVSRGGHVRRRYARTALSAQKQRMFSTSTCPRSFWWSGDQSPMCGWLAAEAAFCERWRPPSLSPACRRSLPLTQQPSLAVLWKRAAAVGRKVSAEYAAWMIWRGEPCACMRPAARHATAITEFPLISA